ncbi:hypothetical protein EVAR_87767_1 [Eumeta japonica]|uniref:Uncharacterized protein n=1 Tax=Eumeta variegata TaxID=151549 RepID=A0A4C1X4W9_EUMVA|nr:hypothetical protein EVAR_87767_1 [Eumeta japonica]
MATTKTWARAAIVLSMLVVNSFARGQTDSGDSWLTSIGRNLHSELTDVLEAVDIQYAEPVINATYRAKEEFNPRGMGPLYNATTVVIDLLVHKQAYPPGKTTTQAVKETCEIDGFNAVLVAENYFKSFQTVVVKSMIKLLKRLRRPESGGAPRPRSAPTGGRCRLRSCTCMNRNAAARTALL